MHWAQGKTKRTLNFKLSLARFQPLERGKVAARLRHLGIHLHLHRQRISCLLRGKFKFCIYISPITQLEFHIHIDGQLIHT